MTAVLLYLVGTILFAVAYTGAAFIANMATRRPMASTLLGVIGAALCVVLNGQNLGPATGAFFVAFPVIFGLLGSAAHRWLRRQGFRLFQ